MQLSRRAARKNTLVESQTASASNDVAPPNEVAPPADVAPPTASMALTASKNDLEDASAAHLWFTLAELAWTRLAVVSTDPEVDALQLCERIATAGRAASGAEIFVSGAEESGGGASASFNRVRRELVPAGDPASSVTARAALASADSVVVCVQFGQTRLSAVQQVLDWSGQKSVLGAFSLVAGR